MKFRMTLLLFVGMIISTTAYAQSSKDTWDNVLLDVELGVGTKYKGLQQANLSLDLGYKIANLFYPYFRTESSLMLYKRDGVKTYGNTWNIGGGAGFIVYKGVDKHDDEPFTVEITGNVTTSVGNYDYKNTDKPNLVMIGHSDTNAINALVASHFNKTWIIDPRFCSREQFEEILSKNHVDYLLITPNTSDFIPELISVPKGYESAV